MCAAPKDSLRYTQSGKAVCDITIGVRGYKDKTDFIRLRFWTKAAEVLSQHCSKGDKITVQGRLCNDSYQDKGETKYYTYVVVEGLDFGFRPRGGSDESAN